MNKLVSVLVLLVFATALLAQVEKPSPEALSELYPAREVVSRYHNDWTQRHYQQRIKLFKKEPLSFGGIVFVGNSITEQGRDWSAKFAIENISNRGIAGDLTDGVLQRLDEIVYYKPKAVFILIGVNDLFNKHYDKDTKHRFKYDKIVPSEQYIAKNICKIAKIIKRKSPDTKLFVRTVLPTRRAYLKADILALNALIRANAKKAPYKVIDLYTQFVDENGEMIQALTKDGVHLNDKGYAKWVAFEKPIVTGL